MAERGAFLRRIRQRAQHRVRFPVADPGPSVPRSVLRGDEPLPELIEHFTAMLTDVGGHVVRVPTSHAAREWVVGFVQQRAAESIVMDRELPVPDLADALARAGVKVAVAPAGNGDDGPALRQTVREPFRQICATADLGITGTTYAVADTGTLVALAGPGHPRTTSLLPPIHVAVVCAGQFVPHLSDLLNRLRETEWRDGLPSAMTLITGPSRTADIEQTLSIGVHGPGEVYVVIVGEEGSDD